MINSVMPSVEKIISDSIDALKLAKKEILDLRKQNFLLKEKLKNGERILKPNNSREKIVKYLKRKPDATFREIQKACRLSSPSVVQHHLRQLEKHKITTE